MPALILPGRGARWNRPEGPLRLNYASRLMEGLVLAVDDRTPRTVWPGSSGTLAGTLQTIVPTLNQTRIWNGLSNEGYTTASVNVGTGQYTIAAWCRRDGAGGNGLGRLFVFDPDLGMWHDGTSWKTADQFGANSQGFTGPADGVIALVSMTVDATTSSVAPVYINGVSVTVSGAARTWPTGAGAWIVGNRSDLGRTWQGIVGPFFVWARGFSASEHWGLWNPATRWDLCWVPGRILYFDVAAVVTGRRSRLAFMGVA